MTRRVLNLLAALSLVLCGLYVVAWKWPREEKTLVYTRWRVEGLTITGSTVWLDWHEDDFGGDFQARRENYWEVCENEMGLSATTEGLPPRGFGTQAFSFQRWSDPGGRTADRSWEWWRFRWAWYEDVMPASSWYEDVPPGMDESAVVVRRTWGQVDLPAWVPPVLFLSFPAARLVSLLRRRARSRARARAGGCANCGYNLFGNPTGVCPECGTATS